MTHPTIMVLPLEIIEGMLTIADDILDDKYMELHASINAFVQDAKLKSPNAVLFAHEDLESFMKDLDDPDVRINDEHPFVKAYKQLIKIAKEGD